MAVCPIILSVTPHMCKGDILMRATNGILYKEFFIYFLNQYGNISRWDNLVS